MQVLKPSLADHVMRGYGSASFRVLSAIYRPSKHVRAQLGSKMHAANAHAFVELVCSDT
jgi:hypothetical protein